MQTLNGLPLIEPVLIDDDLCTALATIEDLQFGVRFVLVAEQTCFELNERVLSVKRKIVLPRHAIRPALDMTTQFLGGHPTGGLRVVKG